MAEKNMGMRFLIEQFRICNTTVDTVKFKSILGHWFLVKLAIIFYYFMHVFMKNLYNQSKLVNMNTSVENS